MVKPNSISPSENKLYLYLPWLALTGLVTVLGYRLGMLLPAWMRWYAMIGAWVLWIALQIFKSTRPWNGVLLLGLSLAAGASLLDGVASGHWLAWGILLLSFALAWLWAYGLKTRLRRAGVVLFPLLLVYLLGWVGQYLLSLPEAVQQMGLILGVLLFAAALVVTVTEARFASTKMTAIAHASDVYVICFNLFWLSALSAADLF